MSDRSFILKEHDKTQAVRRNRQAPLPPCVPGLHYVYDGTWEGWLCCVFHSYVDSEIPERITGPGRTDGTGLFGSREIGTDAAQASRVLTGMQEKLGASFVQTLQRAFLTCLTDREWYMLLVVRKAFRYGTQVLYYEDDEAVHRLRGALTRLGSEIDKWWGFVRFSDIHGVLVSVIGPKNCLLPFLVGISTVKMVMQMGPVGLLTYGWLILVIALGLPLSFIVSALLVCLVSHWQPLAFLQKTVRFSALPFSSSNSSACLPATLKFCTEKLGMNERIVKFTVPVGMQFNMDGTAYYVSVISMVLACTFSVTIDADFLFSLFCVEFLMAMTGVGLLVMPPLLESMGIPGTAVMHFIGIEPIIDMPGTAQNVVGDITSAFLVAQQEGQVDEAVYHS